MEDINQDYYKIRALFEESTEKLTPDKIFISRIENNLKAVDFVKIKFLSYKKRNRIVAMISGVSGFVCGVILSILFPIINSIIEAGILRIISLSPESEFVSNILTWILIALICIGTAVGCYVSFSEESIHYQSNGSISGNVASCAETIHSNIQSNH